MMNSGLESRSRVGRLLRARGSADSNPGFKDDDPGSCRAEALLLDC